MLKIKDNVDLKELEKFGFRHSIDLCYTKNVSDSETCFINISDRCIWFGSGGVSFHIDILFDLVQAGLVEKVEEK